jgi:hypothetical protein
MGDLNDRLARQAAAQHPDPERQQRLIALFSAIAVRIAREKHDRKERPDEEDSGAG